MKINNKEVQIQIQKDYLMEQHLQSKILKIVQKKWELQRNSLKVKELKEILELVHLVCLLEISKQQILKEEEIENLIYKVLEIGWI